MKGRIKVPDIKTAPPAPKPKQGRPPKIKTTKAPKWTVAVVSFSAGVYTTFIISIFLFVLVALGTDMYSDPAEYMKNIESSRKIIQSGIIFLVLPCFGIALVLTLRNFYRIARRHDENAE